MTRNVDRNRPNTATIRDTEAATALRKHIDFAVRELAAFGVEPAIVASCPAKFNDVWNDNNWRAVRIGAFFAERAEYFAPPHEYEQQIRNGPPEARRAERLLDQLEQADWRGLYEKAFERRPEAEELFAIVLQDAASYFVTCASNSGEDTVYDLPTSGGLRLIGRPLVDPDTWQRFDQRLEDAVPLTIRRIEEDDEARNAAIDLLDFYERKSPATPPLGEPRPSHIAIHPGGGISIAPAEPANSLYRRAAALKENGRINEQVYELIVRLLQDANEPPWY